ncbi:hypothetical protein [Legionella longbeachae]|uniref:hypothetical protein n=1 Tax=Legionella longbeachae TaxID=450 RepID=UPI00124516F7|nr:hypothetical protein [Legionella longbeachae]QEY51616.1 hypothetical protein FQU71_10390 [Legionella longbeachae]
MKAQLEQKPIMRGKREPVLEHEVLKSSIPIGGHSSIPNMEHSLVPQVESSVKRLGESFDFSSSTSTGGVTGSTRVTQKKTDTNEETIYFQLKPSILDNKFMRRVKANHTDRENFGEFIASCIGQSISESIGKNNVIPKVYLVYDTERKRALVASKYLRGNAGHAAVTLDGYIKAKNDLPPEKSHATFTEGDQAQGGNIGLDVPYMSPLKDTLIDAIVLSAILGDHDINPGNMVVLTNIEDGQEKIYVARIDLGHAFNDLLNAPAVMGGTVLNPKHPVIDFINREKIAGVNGSPSKLWRDYPGVCTPKEMALFASRLEQIGNTHIDAIEEGAENAQIAFKQLIADMKANKDFEGVQHVLKSLVEIHNNISAEKIKPPFNENHIKVVLNKCADFAINNCQDALHAAMVMKIQSSVHHLSEDSNTNEVFSELDELAKQLDEITWIKCNANTSPAEGTLRQHIIRSKIQVLCEQSGDCNITKIAKNVLSFMDGYKADINSQRIANTKGLQKLEQLEPRIEDALNALANKNIKEAITIINGLKKELRANFGDKNFIGKSIALDAVNKIELDLKKVQMNAYKRAISEGRMASLELDESEHLHASTLN